MCTWPRKLHPLQEAFSDCHSPTATAVTTGLLHCPGQAAPGFYRGPTTYEVDHSEVPF